MAQLEACRAAREKAESEAARREQASAAADEELRTGILRGAEPDETAENRAFDDERRAKKAERAANAPGIGRWYGYCLCFLPAASLPRAFPRVFWIGAAAALLALAAVGIVSAFRSRDRADANRVLHEILDRYGAEAPEDIPERFDEYYAQWEEADALARAAEEEREYAREPCRKGAAAPSGTHGDPRRRRRAAPPDVGKRKEGAASP